MSDNRHICLRCLFLTTMTGLIMLLLVNCSSRYRLDMYFVDGELRKKIDVESTAFAINSQLNNPFGTPKVISGDRSTVVIYTGWRGEPETGFEKFGLGFDEYIKYRIYLEMPILPKPGTIPLEGNSFVRLMKFYEKPPDEKIFLPVSGQFVIDSVKSSDVYATFRNARWENKNDVPVEFDGRIKFQID